MIALSVRRKKEQPFNSIQDQHWQTLPQKVRTINSFNSIQDQHNWWNIIRYHTKKSFNSIQDQRCGSRRPVPSLWQHLSILSKINSAHTTFTPQTKKRFQFYPRSTVALCSAQHLSPPAHFQFYPRSTRPFRNRALFNVEHAFNSIQDQRGGQNKDNVRGECVLSILSKINYTGLREEKN